MTDDEIFRQHHQLSGHEFEQTPGDSEGQGGPCMLQSMQLKRVRQDLATEQQQQEFSVLNMCSVNQREEMKEKMNMNI